MYTEIFKANNDLILNFNNDPKELNKMITIVESAVKKREISEQRIDSSVIKILEAKGIKLKFD